MCAKVLLSAGPYSMAVEAESLTEIFSNREEIKDVFNEWNNFVNVQISINGFPSPSSPTSASPTLLPSDDDLMSSLEDALIKIDKLTEVEWLLLMAYFISEKATKPFEKEALIEEYKAKRGKESNLKNLSRNYPAFIKKYGSAINDKMHRLSKLGVQRAVEILKSNQ